MEIDPEDYSRRLYQYLLEMFPLNDLNLWQGIHDFMIQEVIKQVYRDADDGTKK